MERFQRLDLLAFWARRARRLLPNALLVLTTTLLITAAVFPFTQRQTTGYDIIAALLYFSNYRFAERSVDYFEQEAGSTPVLHFWSLSVEEQFYIVWPLVLLGLVWFRKGHNNRHAIWALSLIACASFACSLLWMSKSQPHAFFHTEARIWQLAGGALLAATYGRIVQLSPIFHSLLGWIGLSGIVASVIMFDDRLAYPGFWALIPVMSTAAVIAGGNAGKLSPKIVLGLSPLQWLGRRSYSVYLWHWPVMMLLPYAVPELPYANFVAIVIVLPIAAAAFSFVEEPIRRGAQEDVRPGRTLAYAAAVGALLCLASTAAPRVDQARSAHQREFIKRITDAKVDGPRMVGGKCEPALSQYDVSCRFGPPNASSVVVLFGDSHAEHLFDGVYEAARSSNRTLWVLTKPACPPIEVMLYSETLRGPDTGCSEWRERAIRRLIAERPSLVLISAYTPYAEKLSNPNTGQRLDRRASVAQWKEGFFAVLRRLNEAGLNVIVVRDTPRSDGRACLIVWRNQKGARAALRVGMP